MRVEVSTGEVLDKISILEIKLHKIEDSKKLANIRKEHLSLLKELNLENATTMLTDELYQNLLTINLSLWHTEDQLRQKEKLQEFDEEFINLARSVYILNDERAQIKRQINEKTNSLLVEEKSYVDYFNTFENDSKSESDIVDGSHNNMDNVTVDE